MQYLGVSPLKGDSCVIFNYGERNCHKRKVLGVGYSAKVCLLMMSSTNSLVNLRRGCSKYSLGLGFSKPKRCSFFPPLALAMEQHEGIDVIDDFGEIRGDRENDDKKSDDGARIDVRALAQSLRSAKSADDVEEVLKQHTGELPLKVFSAMIKGLARDDLMDSAMALVEWLNTKKKETNGVIGANSFVYNSLLFAVKLSKRFEMLGKIMEDMAKQGIELDLVTYNSLMAIYVEQGRASKALSILDEIRDAGLAPSPVTYSTAMTAYRQMEDGFGAVKFFAELREKFKNGDLVRDDSDQDWENEFAKLENYTIRICYQVMRRWLVNSGDLSGNVLKLLSDMDKIGLELGRSELERLVWACTREDHYTVGKELYARIRGKDLKISLSVCNHLIWLMGKARKWWAALEVYEDLLDKGPKPNTLSYELIVSHFNVLLGAARKKGIWKWGLRLLEKMEEKGFKPGTKEWNAVLIACSKASEATAAIEIFKRMIENGEKPTIISYGALLSALEKGKLYEEALRVWDHMVKVGVRPNVYAYTTMASILTGQGDFGKLDALLKEMSSLGIEPTVVTYNAIISRCSKDGFGSAAYEWFHRMKVQGVSPNEVTYEMLIEALGKDGKPRLAYDLYLRAQNEGLKLSRKAYDAVSRSVKEYGATVDLSLLGPQPLEKWHDVRIRKSNITIVET